MTQEEKNNSPKPQVKPAETVETDVAARSLSEALRVTFIVLKLVTVALVVFFIISGLKTVSSGERAIVLRFGKIRGEGEARILKPRSWPYWIFPYPIEELINIPVEKNVTIDIDSFWYFQTEEEKLSGKKKQSNPDTALNPLVDGYCLTRSEQQGTGASAGDDSDYNIFHSKWRLEYQIANPERFFRSVWIGDVKPDQKYFDIIKTSIKPLLRNILESAVVTTMVHYTIDEVSYEKVATISDNVRQLVQEKLDTIESGIRVVSVQLIDKTWPLQVDNAFQDSINAVSIKQTKISQAQTYAKNVLNEAENQAQEITAQARAYRATTVKNAEANAKYLQVLLPEYKKRANIILQDIYNTAIEQILSNADEKFIFQPTASEKGRELRIYLNRNPRLATKQTQPTGTEKTQKTQD